MSEVARLISKLSKANSVSNSNGTTCHTLRKLSAIFDRHGRAPTLSITSTFFHNLVKLLRKPDEKIQGLVLNILYHCCNNQINDAVQDVLFPNLIFVMHHSKVDGIQRRCCKLIGYLAKYRLCRKLHEFKVTNEIFASLNGNTSTDTQLMALRALRLLWSNSSKSDRIGMLEGCSTKIKQENSLIKTLSKFIPTDNKNIMNTVLCIIHQVSEFHPEFILSEMEKYGCISPIIFQLPHSPIVAKIIMELSIIPEARIQLARANIMEPLIQYLQQSLVAPNKHDTSLFMALYLLCLEPICRSHLRHVHNSFVTLLSIFRRSLNFIHRKCLVLTIYLFIYHDDTFSVDVKNDLVLVLIEYVQYFVDESTTNEFESTYEHIKNLEPDENSADYTSTKIKNNVLAESLSCNTLNEHDSVLTYKYCKILNAADDHVAVFRLLKKLTFFKPPIKQYSLTSTWTVLVNYLVLTNKEVDHALFILSSIAGNKNYFSELLNSSFPLIIHKKLCRPIHYGCKKCEYLLQKGNQILDTFSCTAQSDYGKGIISNELSKTDSDHRPIILSIPLISNVNTLIDSFVRYHILDKLLELNIKDEFLNDIVAALYSLANKLGIIFIQSSYTVPDNICIEKAVTDNSTTFVDQSSLVSFSLDDDSVVNINKGILCKASPVFEAMLQGNFKESEHSIIRLANITQESFELIKALIDRGFHNFPLKQYSLSILLETIIQCDKFLISDFSKKILFTVMECKLSYDNCHVIYNWVLNSGDLQVIAGIRESIIKYILSTNLKFKNRVYGFKMLLESKYSAEVIIDIKHVIIQYLNLSENNNKQCILKNVKRFKLSDGI